MIRKDIAGLKEAKELLTKTAIEGLQENKAFVKGDHWQGGAGWVGPRPAPEEEGSAEVLVEIQRSFVSSNRILEVCDRHASAIVGREPTWTLVAREPDPDQDPEKDPLREPILEANAALTTWWNERGVPARLHEAVVAHLWGRRAVLRLYVPKGVREDPALINAESLEAALGLIHLEVVEGDVGMVHVDADSKRELGIIAYKDQQDEDVVELSYLDDTREKTLVEVMTGDKSAKSDPLEMGGRITTFEMSRRAALVSPQLRQQQRSHNLALSMLPRNLVTGGFLERVILNAQMPGHWEVDEATGERKRFVPSRLRLGAGMTTFLEGASTTDLTTGKEVIASPDIKYREPVSVDSSVDGAHATYQTMLEEARQSYVLLNTSAGVSGKSRVEARKDFDTSLKPTRLEVEKAGRWLIETVLAIAENFYGKVGQFTEPLRADFTCVLEVVGATPEERQQNTRDVEAGILPKDYAQRAAGIDDTDAAQAEIDAEPDAQLRVIQKRVAIFKEATAAGMDAEAAANVAGFSEEDIKLIVAGVGFVEPGDGGDGESDDVTDEEGADAE